MKLVEIASVFIACIFCYVNFAFALDYDPTYPPLLFLAKVIREKGYEAFQFLLL